MRLIAFAAMLLAASAGRPNDKQDKQHLRQAADPGNYYANINANVNGTALQTQLTKLISSAKSLTYTDLWTAFKTVDALSTNECGSSFITDIYSDKCWTTSEQCGNYQTEGDCYNREHAWPKSWWGGATNAAYTDILHIFPADGYDNNRRSNYPLGFVGTPTYTTSDGSKLGSCKPAPGFTGSVPSICWEPSARYKGELARAYFYVSTRYGAGAPDAFTCCDEDGVNGSTIKPWMLATLLNWHNAYPPSPSEQQRNDLIYSQFQGNRNPFIDFPAWVAQIWASNNNA